MDACQYPIKESVKLEGVTHLWPSNWPNLSSLLKSLDHRINRLQINQVAGGHKAIIRFKNGYGLEISKYCDDDLFEMTVIKFWEGGIDHYDFAFNTPLPDLSMGYSDEDILRLCSQVSELR